MDGLGFFNSRAKADQIVFRKHVVHGRFVCPHPELPGFSIPFPEKRNGASFSAELNYCFADCHQILRPFRKEFHSRLSAFFGSGMADSVLRTAALRPHPHDALPHRLRSNQRRAAFETSIGFTVVGLSAILALSFAVRSPA